MSLAFTVVVPPPRDSSGLALYGWNRPYPFPPHQLVNRLRECSDMSEQAFPPEDPASFLNLCDGEWMSLRSCFELAAGGDDEWHSSERGELTVRCVSRAGGSGSTAGSGSWRNQQHSHLCC